MLMRSLFKQGLCSLIVSMNLSGGSPEPRPDGSEFLGGLPRLWMMPTFSVGHPSEKLSQRSFQPFSCLRQDYEERLQALPSLVEQVRDSDVSDDEYGTPINSPVKDGGVGLDTTPQIYAYFSGGGAKGLLQASAQRAICEETGIKLRDLYDAVAGTSVGAILGAASAFDVLSAEDCVNFFKEEVPGVFPASLWNKFITMGGFAAPVYSREPLDLILQDKFGDKKLSDARIPYAAVSVLQYQDPYGFWSNPVSHIFNSKIAIENLLLHDTHMSHVLAATSAAPSYFRSPEWEYAGKKARALDGGLVANSPDNEVLLLAYEHYQKLGSDDIVLLYRTGGLDPKLEKKPGFITRSLNRISPFRRGGLYEHAGSVFHSFMDSGLAEGNARRLATSLGIKEENIFTLNADLSDTDMARVDVPFLTELEEKGGGIIEAMEHGQRDRLLNAVRTRAEAR